MTFFFFSVVLSQTYYSACCCSYYLTTEHRLDPMHLDEFYWIAACTRLGCRESLGLLISWCFAV